MVNTADEDVDLWMKKVPRLVKGAELSWRSMVIREPWEEPQRHFARGGREKEGKS